MRFKKLKIFVGIALVIFFFIVGNTIAFGQLYSSNNKTSLNVTNSSYALIKENGDNQITTTTSTQNGSTSNKKTTTSTTTKSTNSNQNTQTTTQQTTVVHQTTRSRAS